MDKDDNTGKISQSQLRQIIKEEIKEAKKSFSDLIKSELYDIWEKKVETKSKIALEEQDLSRVAEKTYKRTFWLMVFLVISASFGNAVARWISGDSHLELIPKNIFDFIKDVIYVFIIPVTIKIVGDQAPVMINAFLAFRGINPTVTKEREIDHEDRDEKYKSNNG
jgi:hypothetical protein